MGKNIKRLSLALIALGLSAPAFADQCNPFQVTVPSFNGGFSIGADALYMQPSVPNGSYFTVAGPNVGTATNVVFNNTTKSIDPDYQWGFDVTAGYRIPCTGNDVTATWTHLGNNGSHTDNTPLAAPFTILVPGSPILVTATNALVKGSLDFNNYDAVDLDLGQTVNFGDYFKFRVFTGVRWAQVQENVNASISGPITATIIGGPTVTGTGFASADENSKFDGVGPQVGFDGRYCLGYGFGLDANLTTSLLVGRVDANASTTGSLTTAAAAFNVSTTTNNDFDDKTRVVPALDGSLGLDYTYNFNNCDRSSVVVQAGWKVINYWNVAHDGFRNGGSPLNNAVSPNIATNVAFQGPYAGIKVNL